MYLQQQVENESSVLRQGTLTRHIESLHIGHDLGCFTSANRRAREIAELEPQIHVVTVFDKVSELESKLESKLSGSRSHVVKESATWRSWVPEVQSQQILFECDYECGFRGSRSDVAIHEMTCAAAEQGARVHEWGDGRNRGKMNGRGDALRAESAIDRQAAPGGGAVHAGREKAVLANIKSESSLVFRAMQDGGSAFWRPAQSRPGKLEVVEAVSYPRHGGNHPHDLDRAAWLIELGRFLASVLTQEFPCESGYRNLRRVVCLPVHICEFPSECCAHKCACMRRSSTDTDIEPYFPASLLPLLCNYQLFLCTFLMFCREGTRGAATSH